MYHLNATPEILGDSSTFMSGTEEIATFGHFCFEIVQDDGYKRNG